jgi:hypothetical protein
VLALHRLIGRRAPPIRLTHRAHTRARLRPGPPSTLPRQTGGASRRFRCQAPALSRPMELLASGATRPRAPRDVAGTIRVFRFEPTDRESSSGVDIAAEATMRQPALGLAGFCVHPIVRSSCWHHAGYMLEFRAKRVRATRGDDARLSRRARLSLRSAAVARRCSGRRADFRIVGRIQQSRRDDVSARRRPSRNVPAISRGSESEPVVAGTRRRSGSAVASVTDRPACSRQRSSSSLGSLAEWRPPLAHTVAPRSSGKRCLVALIGEHLAG